MRRTRRPFAVLPVRVVVLPKMDALRAAGFSVMAVDYRGWGESTPIVPSEASIDADAEDRPLQDHQSDDVTALREEGIPHYLDSHRCLRFGGRGRQRAAWLRAVLGRGPVGGFPARERLLQLVVDRIADQDERAEPQPLGVRRRFLERDLLDRDVGPGILLVKALAARQLVEQEGLRLTSNIVGCAPDDVRIGMPVEAYAIECEAGMAVPFWRPAASK